MAPGLGTQDPLTRWYDNSMPHTMLTRWNLGLPPRLYSDCIPKKISLLLPRTLTFIDYVWAARRAPGLCLGGF